jgi:putative RecB family exonuclease
MRRRPVGRLAYSPGMTSGTAEPDTAAIPELGLSPEEPLLEGLAPAGPSLSPSRAADFMTCPLLYRFRVIDRIPEAPSPAATRGTVVHSVLEQLFDLPAVERTLSRAQAMLGPQWEQLLEAEPELAVLVDSGGTGQLPEFLAGADGLLEQYFALEDPTRLEPRERELRVEVELGSGLALRGFVDRLDVSPAGDMRVVDYKTGRAPSPGFEAKAMFQMRFYALVLWKLYGRVPRLLQLLYLGSGEVLRYEPDEADLRATEVKVEALWRAIERATETGDWRPSPSRLCDWCDHRDIRCPAWGGTAPPLPTTLPTLQVAPPAAPSGPSQGGDQGRP